MKKIFLLSIVLVMISGCNSVYQYVFLPPERLEYAIYPDQELLNNIPDTNYFVSKDGKVIGYNAKSWKIEIRYMSDYQLNVFEFPEESKQLESSGNPYTYANWVDPTLGYTPRRFSVFKVTIYNYTSSKINFDPELSMLLTERGDKLNAYAREKKNSRFYSMEEYYTKRKGTAGLDEEVFETRMGIVRRTMLSYGKPIYKGDTRDGLVIFDPILDDVKQLKIKIDKFIVGYDENNEPSDFINLEFFFKQHPVEKEELDSRQTDVVAIQDTSVKTISVAQIKYSTPPSQTAFEQPWNPYPKCIPNLLGYAQRNLSVKTKFYQGSFDDEGVANSKIAFILGGGVTPEVSTSFITNCAEYLSNGGFLYIDNCYFKDEYPFSAQLESFLGDVQKKLVGKTEIKRINLDHQIFSIYKPLNTLPLGYDDMSTNITKSDEIKGLFLDGKLIAVVSNKGYPIFWSDEGSSYDNSQQIDFGLNLINYSLKK